MASMMPLFRKLDGFVFAYLLNSVLVTGFNSSGLTREARCFRYPLCLLSTRSG